MTTLELTRINLALEKTGGRIADAADILQMKPATLKARIHHNPELKERWRKKAHKDNTVPTPVTPAESLNRLELPVPTEMSDEERKVAEAMMREDTMLKEGLERLNLTEAEQALALEFAAFNTRFFVKSADICMSGITVLGMKLQTEAADRKTRLDEVRRFMREYFSPQPAVTEPVDPNAPKVEKPPLPFTREQLAEEEQFLMASYDNCVEIANRLANTHLKAMMLQAMVKFRLRNGSTGVPKPGYQERPQEKVINGDGQHQA